MDELQRKKLWSQALFYLSRQMRSEKEVREYLTKKIADNADDSITDNTEKADNADETVRRLINGLKELKFIDDVQFAKMWVRSRKSTRGKRRLALELQKKGIKKEIINELLNKKNENQSNGDQSLVTGHWPPEETEIDEEKTAKELAEKRRRRYVGLPSQKAKERLVRYLAGRGFGWETIKKTLVSLPKLSSGFALNSDLSDTELVID